MRCLKIVVIGFTLALAVVALGGDRRVLADQIPEGWTAHDMKPIGYSDLDGRGGAFKMAIREVAGKWYLYLGHMWHRGWSIVDVTDPANPKTIKFISWPHDNTWTKQMELHGNIMVTALERHLSNYGGDAAKSWDEGVVFWDITDPINPIQLSIWKTGSTGEGMLSGTHRNSYPGGKYAYLSASMPGFRSNILVILDISDPKNPKEAGRWWIPGQKEDEKPASSDPLYYYFHGPAVIDGTTAYLGYGHAMVILDISDVSKPKLVGRLNFDPPFGGLVVHDVLPIPSRGILFAHAEATKGDNPSSVTCNEPALLAGMVDIKDLTKPHLISLFPTPVPPKGSPYKDFCDKGGRFGPHNTNLEYHLPDVEKTQDLIYLTYFNAGLRIYDIKNPRLPQEVGWFIPPTPVKRHGPIPAKLVTQTEDVLVDRRGNVYITDKQWGLFVLRYTGPGATAASATR